MKPGQTAVAWDNYCEYYVSIDELAGGCVGYDPDAPRHKLRRRVGWICVACEIHPIFFDRLEYEADLDSHVVKAKWGE